MTNGVLELRARLQREINRTKLFASFPTFCLLKYRSGGHSLSVQSIFPNSPRLTRFLNKIKERIYLIKPVSCSPSLIIDKLLLESVLTFDHSEIHRLAQSLSYIRYTHLFPCRLHVANTIPRIVQKFTTG